MSKKYKTELVVIFAFVFLWGVFIFVSGQGRKKQQSLGQLAVVAVRGEVKGTEMSEREEEIKNLKLRRDPFTGLMLIPDEVSSDGEINLTGIIWDKNKPFAIINDKIFGVGDKIMNQLIIAIKEDRIILSNGITDTEINIED